MTFGRGRGPGPGTATNSTRQGQPEGSSSGSQSVLDKLMASGKKRLGDKYGVGQHHYAPPGGAVSCSGLIYSMRKDAGLPNPYWGTYGYYNNYTRGPGGIRTRYVGGKGYSAGTLFVATSGAGGPDGTHVAMSVGDGKVIESIMSGGVQISPQPGSFADKSQVFTGIMPDVGTGVTDAINNPGEAVGDAAEAVGNMAGDIASGVAEGIAQGLLRVLKYIYGKLILQPLDFVSGFWWEFLKHFWTQVGGSDLSASSDTTQEEPAITDESGSGEFVVKPGEWGGGSF